MIKTETFPNGYTSITGCSNCDDAQYLWFDEGQWVIDSDDGYRGFPAKYCPACGTHLTQRAPDSPSAEGRLTRFGKFLVRLGNRLIQNGGG